MVDARERRRFDTTPGSNVLHLREESAAGDGATRTRAVPKRVAAEPQALVVSFRRAATEIAADWERRASDRATALGIVTVDAGGPPGRDRPRVDPTEYGGRVDATRARILADIGVAVSEYLADWDDGRRTALWFDSVDDLLAFTDHERAFRFLHVLTGRIARADAIGVYHMDPTAHEPQTVTSTMHLFDAVEGDKAPSRT